MISDSHTRCPRGCRETVHCDCSCQEDAKLPKLVLSYVFLQREKLTADQMLAMSLEMYEARRIDLEEEFDHVQRRSRYDQEEAQGRSLLRQLDQGVPAAALILNDGGDAPDQGMDVEDAEEEESMDTDDQGAAASTDDSYRPSDPDDPPSPSTRPYNRQNRVELLMTSLAKMHGGFSNRDVSILLTCWELDKARKNGTWDPSMIVDHSKVFRGSKKTAKLMVGLRNEELAAGFEGWTVL